MQSWKWNCIILVILLMLKRDYIKTKNIEILPITEKISEQVLTLPMYPNMENEEKEYLIDSVSQFFEINS